MLNKKSVFAGEQYIDLNLDLLMKLPPISAILRSQVFHYNGMLALSFMQSVLVSFLCNFKLNFF